MVTAERAVIKLDGGWELVLVEYPASPTGGGWFIRDEFEDQRRSDVLRPLPPDFLRLRYRYHPTAIDALAALARIKDMMGW